MSGKCENCAKANECSKTIGIMFGFCNTDFEPCIPKGERGNMRYFRKDKFVEREAEEIRKDMAEELLRGFYADAAVIDIFENDRAFRLTTPYSTIYTKDEKGRVPVAGFYGVVG